MLGDPGFFFFSLFITVAEKNIFFFRPYPENVYCMSEKTTFSSQSPESFHLSQKPQRKHEHQIDHKKSEHEQDKRKRADCEIRHIRNNSNNPYNSKDFRSRCLYSFILFIAFSHVNNSFFAPSCIMTLSAFVCARYIANGMSFFFLI